MIRSDLKFAVASDIHLGHKTVSADFIIENLERAFPDNAETAALDIIFLAGDVFDKLLNMANPAWPDVLLWASRFLKLCKKHNILLRVLEGTPSHDWRQSNIFPVMNKATDAGADLKYVKTLSIEHIEQYGITVLYVPDEWENDTEKTLAQVRELLKAQGLDKVDFAIMHGQFEFQLPPHVAAQKHDSQAYLSLVRELICIGHVHEYSTFDRIIAQGSFDRLNHGTEIAKGHVRVSYTNGERSVTFVENHGAKRFDTLDCMGLSLAETLTKINEHAATLPKGSHIRIEADKGSPIFSHMTILDGHHPFIRFSKLVRGEVGKKSAIAESFKDDYVPMRIDSDNVVALLTERMQKRGLPPEVLRASAAILKESV